MKEMIGEQILNYRIDKLLSEEDRGAVYLASHTRMHKQVVIKEIDPYLAADPMIHERFRNGAAIIATLQHPNIVQLLELVESNGNMYLVTEYIEGITLNDYLQRLSKPLSDDKAIQLFLKIIDACIYAHQKRVLHLDIKPANVLITRDENPEILNFGIAGIFAEAASNFTDTGKNSTSIYLSPEQVHGKRADERSDVYAIGVLLSEMLTGRLAAHAHMNPEPVINNHLQAIIDQAMAKNPEDRFQSCRSFKESLFAEKERQQDLTLARLMQEVAEKGHHQTVSENISTIKAAKIQSRNKKIQIGFIAFSLLVAAFYVFRFSMIGFDKIDFSAFLPVATEETSMADANTEMPGQQPVGEAVNLTASATLAATARKEALTKQDFQQFLTAYYKTLQEKNTSRAKQFYAPPLTRFFSEYGVSSGRLNELIEQTWQQTSEYRHEVLWDTLRYYKDDSDNYILDFYMNYHYRPGGNSGWQQKKLYTMIKMNKDFKIFYITGD